MSDTRLHGSAERRTATGAAAALLGMTLLLLVSTTASIADAPLAGERFQPLARLIGTWQGATVKPDGSAPGVVEKSARYVLGGQFMEIETHIAFPPEMATTFVDVRHEFMFVSYDASKDRFVARSFFTEGFVIEEAVVVRGNGIVFESRVIENAPEGMRTRTTLSWNQQDELEQLVEIEMPGIGFKTYQTMTLRRVQ